MILNKKIKIKYANRRAFVRCSDICKWLKKEHIEKIRVLSNAETITVVSDNDWGNVRHSTWFWVVA
tara:strand:- start:235 stop:432 length:198 start_codon:yes stop_codon:yes gene_type:complete